MSPEFSAFLATLDSQVAGPESRPINVGAICAETRDEWGGLEEQAKRRECVLTTVREFVALGLLPGGTWPHTSPSATKRLPSYMDGSGAS